MKGYKMQVHKMDDEGNILCTYDSVADAEDDLEIFQNNIVQCCRGTRKKAGGFRWKYVEEEMK